VRGVTRDIVVGVLAGLTAVAVLSLRREGLRIPPGLYQATLNEPKYREMAVMLRPPTGSAEALKKLQVRVNAPDVQGAALDQVLAYLADVCGVEIEVDWGVLGAAGVARNARVNVRLRDVSVAEALRQTLASAAEDVKLAYHMEGGRIRVSTRDEFSKHLVTRVYDVRDIIKGMISSDASLLPPKRGPGGGAPGPLRSGEGFASPRLWTDFVTTPRQAVEHLTEIATTEVDPPSWSIFGGSVGRIQYFAGRLIVTQTLPNHDELAAILYWMREEIGHESKPQ
jgi:hypothetical protein